MDKKYCFGCGKRINPRKKRVYKCFKCGKTSDKLGYFLVDKKKVYHLGGYSCFHRSFDKNKFKKIKMEVLDKCNHCDSEFLIPIQRPKNIKFKTKISYRTDSFSGDSLEIKILDNYIGFFRPKREVSKIIKQLQLKKDDKLIVEIRKNG